MQEKGKEIKNGKRRKCSKSCIEEVSVDSDDSEKEHQFDKLNLWPRLCHPFAFSNSFLPKLC